MRKLLLPILLLVLAGCNDAETQAIAKKCNAPLRERIEAAASSKTPVDLSILGKCNGPVDSARHAALTKAGADVRSVTGDIFAARVPAQRIGAVAVKDFVTQLELSGESQPLQP